jgi:hypothetical protein
MTSPHVVTSWRRVWATLSPEQRGTANSLSPQYARASRDINGGKPCRCKSLVIQNRGHFLRSTRTRARGRWHTRVATSSKRRALEPDALKGSAWRQRPTVPYARKFVSGRDGRAQLAPCLEVSDDTARVPDEFPPPYNPWRSDRTWTIRLRRRRPGVRGN